MNCATALMKAAPRSLCLCANAGDLPFSLAKLEIATRKSNLTYCIGAIVFSMQL